MPLFCPCLAARHGRKELLLTIFQTWVVGLFLRSRKLDKVRSERQIQSESVLVYKVAM